MQIHSEKLKQLRSSKPWSQDELATASGVSLRTIQRAERDGAASLQTLKAIAAALNVDLSVLRVSAAEPSATQPVALDVQQPPVSTQRFRARNTLLWACVILAGLGLLTILRGSWPDFRRPQSLPLAARILGHWESSSTGAVVRIDLDGKTVSAGGDVNGRSAYTLLGDVITYSQRGRIISRRVTLPAPQEMVWTDLTTGAVSRFTRNKVVLPSREEVYASVSGNWYGQGDMRALRIDLGKLKLTFADGHEVETGYLISGLRISFNLDGAMQSFVVEVAGNTLTLTKPFSSLKHAFTRPPPPQHLHTSTP